MILNRQNLSENNWNPFKIVPQGHNHCQLSIVNCQFGLCAEIRFTLKTGVCTQYTVVQRKSHPPGGRIALRAGEFYSFRRNAREETSRQAHRNRLRAQ